MKRFLFGAALISVALSALGARAAETAKIVLVAGHASHGPGDHEHKAGMLLLCKCLKEAMPNVEPVVISDSNGWPTDESVFEGAKAVVFFMDGGGGNPAIQGDRLATLQKLADKGVGLGFIHYSVEVPKGKPGDHFLKWIGGYYETGFSTNPMWKAEFAKLPDHPILRGVKPFSINDEWYFNIRFRPEMAGITPLLAAAPPDSVRGPDRPQAVQDNKGRAEVVSWCVERTDGGRGFGFTGGHFHKNWGDANFRTFVLNAIVWVAKLDVPANGVQCTVTSEDLTKNLDRKK